MMESIHATNLRRWRWLTSIVTGSHLAIIALLTWPLLFSGVELNFPFSISLLSLLMITVHRSNCIPLLLALQISLFFQEPRSLNVLEGISSIAFSTVGVALVMYVCQYRFVRDQVSRSAIDALVPTIPNPRSGAMSSGRVDRLEGPRLESIVPRSISRAIIFTLAAQLIMVQLPFARGASLADERVVLQSVGYSPSPTGLVILLAIAIIVREILWRQLTVEQARFFVRSVAVNLLFRDLRMIVKRTLSSARRNPGLVFSQPLARASGDEVVAHELQNDRPNN